MTQEQSIKPTPLYTAGCEVIDPAIWPDNMQRIALAVEYKGTDFHGFQVQPNGVKTVQGALERALSKVADEPISLICAGRTDAGVHATNQVVHFDTTAKRPLKAWTMGVRPHLPDTVGVRWAAAVAPQFHARFSALERTYRYLITDGAKPALLHDQITWSAHRLDVDLMRHAAEALVGEQDFTSFRATQCQARSPVRNIHYVHFARRGDLIIMEIRANAFLHHMVRNIVGVLMAVGAGHKPADWVKDVLLAKDRAAGGVTAKPFGLYLVEAAYPAHFGLPQAQPGPLFLPDPLTGFAQG